MELHADASIPFPRDVVFATYRDHIAELVPFLPNVRSIQVRSRSDDGAVATMVNDWHGGGDIPGAVRAIVGDAMLSWTDHARWDATTFRCDWRTETQAFAEALQCSGVNEFLEDGPGKTRLLVRGTLQVDAKKVRGVPGFLAGKVGRTIEEFLGSRINVNLAETGKALTRYLESKR
ncbi:MAG: hypothetical protein JOZ69_13435 [Myxococcales bacterium]|nr:hypothetical protein [Myxococcales bacterium]